MITLFEDANKLLEKVKMELSVQEENFVKQSIAKPEISSPKLLIKYCKKINKKVELPTRLVIPATFSNTGYLGIKRIPDKGKVNY